MESMAHWMHTYSNPSLEENVVRAHTRRDVRYGRTLLLSEVNGILLSAEGQTRALHVIGTAHPRHRTAQKAGMGVHSRTGPTHQGVLPTTTAGEYVPVNSPTIGLAGPALGGAARGLEDADGAVTELLCDYPSRSSPRWMVAMRRLWTHWVRR